LCRAEHRDAETPYWLFLVSDQCEAPICRNCAHTSHDVLLRAVDFINWKNRDFEAEIRPNNCTMRESCVLCEVSHKDAATPYWIFEKGTHGSICHQCAEKHYPELLKSIEEQNEEAWRGYANEGKQPGEEVEQENNLPF